MNSVWEYLLGFVSKIGATAIQTAVPIAEGAVDTVIAANPALSPFETIGNALIQGAAQFAQAAIHPNAAAVAVAQAVAAKKA